MITLDQRCSKPGLKEHWYKKYKTQHALQTVGIVGLVDALGLSSQQRVEFVVAGFCVQTGIGSSLKQLAFVVQGCVQTLQKGCQPGVIACFGGLVAHGRGGRGRLGLIDHVKGQIKRG